MPNDFEHMPGFKDFLLGRSKEANKVNLLKKPRKADSSKSHFTVANLLLLKKAIRKLKGGGDIRSDSPVWIGMKKISRLEPIATLAKS